MKITFLTGAQLAKRLHYSERHIREYLKDRHFVEGVHYVRLPGARRILYVWENIANDMLGNKEAMDTIPMANGGVCHG